MNDVLLPSKVSRFKNLKMDKTSSLSLDRKNKKKYKLGVLNYKLSVLICINVNN